MKLLWFHLTEKHHITASNQNVWCGLILRHLRGKRKLKAQSY
nr:MAG TPA: hypothetical protein [Caudoviricetes sp.]